MCLNTCSPAGGAVLRSCETFGGWSPWGWWTLKVTVQARLRSSLFPGLLECEHRFCTVFPNMMDSWFSVLCDTMTWNQSSPSTLCCQVLGRSNENSPRTHYVILNICPLGSTPLADQLTTLATDGLAHQIYQDSFSLRHCWFTRTLLSGTTCSEIKSKWKFLDRLGQRLRSLLCESCTEAKKLSR